MTTIDDVKNYWQKNPLLSFELEKPGSEEFFFKLDHIKINDVEKFSLDFWEFDKFKDKSILDVGCGPGWYTVNYALGGAVVHSIDLTSKAVELTNKNLSIKNLTASVKEGNAEELEFEDNYFDLVISSGVLHHTPDTGKAFKECFRVIRPGGRAKITLYRKGLLHRRFIFLLVKAIMKLLKIRHPGADLAQNAKNVDDFIRQYDGASNPIGRGEKVKDWAKLIKDTGFSINNCYVHYFPKRLLPFGGMMPKFIHKFLDNYFGLMVYFDLTKPRK